jgi:hypothetical protein
MLDKTEVKVEDPKGNLKNYKDSDTKSGNTITRQFCGQCGWCVDQETFFFLVIPNSQQPDSFFTVR